MLSLVYGDWVAFNTLKMVFVGCLLYKLLYKLCVLVVKYFGSDND